MKHKLLIALLIHSLMGYGQEYVIEKVHLTETFENKTVSEIPRLKDISAENNPVVERINSQILDRFMINSFVQGELEEFRWYEVRCSSEVKDSMLYISFAGEYYGAYPNYVTDELFFDLNSGDPLKATVIPFQALFTLSGYLDFLHTCWLEGVKTEFRTAVECAGMDPYCSYYDIQFTFDGNNLVVALTDDCYPHVAQKCSPVYSVSMEPDSLAPYLNSIGKYMLLGSHYRNLTAIGKFQEEERLKDQVPDNVFLFGNLGGKYPISMALDLDNPEVVTGLYLYNIKLQHITLNGHIKEDTLYLTETAGNKQTGFFEFDLNTDHIPIEGKWMNADKTKSLNVTIDNILTNRNN